MKKIFIQVFALKVIIFCFTLTFAKSDQKVPRAFSNNTYHQLTSSLTSNLVNNSTYLSNSVSCGGDYYCNSGYTCQSGNMCCPSGSSKCGSGCCDEDCQLNNVCCPSGSTACGDKYGGCCKIGTYCSSTDGMCSCIGSCSSSSSSSKSSSSNFSGSSSNHNSCKISMRLLTAISVLIYVYLL
ncbi:hypothetical protein C2G38_1674201 [Gigaspora rosea]|uniref:Granulins domain-containing protein n=1 Tax=Gigaspora rosea TaxID=44941 RepID=A0A397UX83_9GLOM|nr:hypothetical protein C2G38_1674201 [Gigaspora rosea]